MFGSNITDSTMRVLSKLIRLASKKVYYFSKTLNKVYFVYPAYLQVDLFTGSYPNKVYSYMYVCGIVLHTTHYAWLPISSFVPR